MVEKNWVDVIGTIWMPAITCAMRYPLSKYDIENIGEFTRENVDQWLTTHAGDFQDVKDFYATVGDQEIPWSSEESEFTYNDCMFPGELE
tara:strand:- start:486 stop:755 length:270 start_codon:yes stop_codon:yes gene_type:complete